MSTRISSARAALVAFAVLIATSVAAAAKAPTFTFVGGGFGHGVGMSQFGAYGAAKAGWDAPRILAYYYRGVSFSQIGPGAIRVLVRSGGRQVRASSAVAWQIVDEVAQPNTAFALAPNVSYTVQAFGAGVRVRNAAGDVVATLPGLSRLQPVPADGAIAIAQGTYRGALRLVRDGAAIDVVNVVDVEQYLLGVVPREMPSRWGDDAPAALQAQAIAARTYAVRSAKPSRAYDVLPDDRSQVYGGVLAEDPRTSAAVQATRGQVLTYAGQLITAFFFSTSGGKTENVENVFPAEGPKPYLVGVDDPFDVISPQYRWPDPPRFTGAALGKKLGLGQPVVRTKVERRGVSGRVLEFTVIGRDRSVTLAGRDVRRALDLRDTLFWIVRRP
ncbi:MAG: SpoIID/LytB domain-containing protein [Actinobacteria bacterium]|nr:SpoIID/LytB domain-containing protein [Actinomycetota bacterium]